MPGLSASKKKTACKCGSMGPGPVAQKKTGEQSLGWWTANGVNRKGLRTYSRVGGEKKKKQGNRKLFWGGDENRKQFGRYRENQRGGKKVYKHVSCQRRDCYGKKRLSSLRSSP